MQPPDGRLGVEAAAGAPAVAVRVEGLTKRYHGVPAVNGLSFGVLAGEIFGLLGPNGAGKTTTMNMLCGLLQPDAGTVSIHGRPLCRGNRDVRLQVGVCPQEAVLWERLTGLEQLQFAGQMYGMAGPAARRSGRQLLADLDLDAARDKQARMLSGGMKRRLSLAMALIHDPQIVVLDEPEAGLDPQSRVAVREYIRGLAGRKTVILTTHDMDEADRMVDRLAIIDRGNLLVLDTPQALKRAVGGGDIVEIALDGGQETLRCVEPALAAFVDRSAIQYLDGRLIIRSLDVVSKLAAILGALAGCGLRPGEVHVRANSLEDVFIQLTGRRLRQ